MFELNGKYNNCKVFTDNCENETIAQLTTLLNQEFVSGSQIRIMPDCLPIFTEVLTTKGFKKIIELSKDDLIANYDINTKKIYFSKPINIINRPLRNDEVMYEFNCKQSNFSFYGTENHRMLTKQGVVLSKDINDITTLSDYVFFADGLENPIKKYSDLEIQLICWIVGDGSITDNGNGSIRVKFSFKKERKLERLTYLLDLYGIGYHTHIEKRGDTSICVNTESSSKLISLIGDKKEFPLDFIFMNKHQAQIFNDELIQVDGDYNNYKIKRGYRFSSASKHNIDITQIIFSINNNLCCVQQKKNDGRLNDLFYINKVSEDTCEYAKNGFHHRKIVKSKLNYNENVCCVECETSFFVARQNGLVFITGNCHAGAGCVIGTTMTLHDKVCCNLVGVDIGCLDKDSEVLTPSGWIKISDYNGEKILIYDKENDAAFFDMPYAYIKEECDEFYYFKNGKNFEQMLSKEHKMLVFEGYKKKGYIPKIYLAEEFYKKMMSLKKCDYYNFKTTFHWNSNGLSIEDDILRLLVMESADGHLEIRTNGDCYTELHFRKERKILRVKELLNRCNISYKETIGPDGTTYIYFKDNRINTKDLRFLYGASKHQLEIVADEVFYWDDSVDNERNHKNYCTTIKTNADVIQWVFACLGIRAGIYAVNDKRCSHYSTHYLVYPTNNEYVSLAENKPEIVKSKDGYKYCFTTSTGFFVMRRNDNISITGNCGMLTIKLKEKRINLPELDSVIKKYIPFGGDIHEEAVAYSNIEDMACVKAVNIERGYKSLGSLGGGNHFIEVDKSESGDLYLVIHTGSRHLGIEVCNYYQEAGYKALQEKATGGSLKDFSDALIAKLKAEGRQRELSSELAKLKADFKLKNPSIPYELSYVEGENFKNYIHDMKVMREHAEINRATIAKIIMKKAKLHEVERFETVHNYIDTDNMILRKGSVSAQDGEKLLIPMNMRDGSLICIGKGNPDWNFSAPHGAGRLMSRSKAKESISMSDFKKSMEGIYTTCVNTSTIDESPMAYKPMDEIIENIKDTVEIVDIIKPIYNFKASEM